jgi:hypothetical protein
MPEPPALTPEQRRAALEKAASLRRERAVAKEKSRIPPALTPEQRRAALEKAARVRRDRAVVKEKLKMGNLTLDQLLTEADSDETVGKMKVVSVLESLPGLGKVKARRLMETVGISDSRRLQGLGAKQREAILVGARERYSSANQRPSVRAQYDPTDRTLSSNIPASYNQRPLLAFSEAEDSVKNDEDVFDICLSVIRRTFPWTEESQARQAASRLNRSMSSAEGDGVDWEAITADGNRLAELIGLPSVAQ